MQNLVAHNDVVNQSDCFSSLGLIMYVIVPHMQVDLRVSPDATVILVKLWILLLTYLPFMVMFMRIYKSIMLSIKQVLITTAVMFIFKLESSFGPC